MVVTEQRTTPPDGVPGLRGHRFRHRKALFVAGIVVLVAAAGCVTFAVLWQQAQPSALSNQAAVQRFRSGLTGATVAPGTLRPPQGVYSFTGTADEHVSLPPKSQHEGPGMPATVTYERNGCWVFRMDYSDSHWQSGTYCPRNGNLVQVGRAGWYRWDFVAFTIADTATFTCAEPQMVLPSLLERGRAMPFTCTGTNSPIQTGVVTMTGTTTYLGVQVLPVAGQRVETVHVREIDRFSGGQTGTNVSDTWFSTTDALPVKGTWRTEVNSPSPVGTSTMTGAGSFVVTSLTPKS